MKTLVVVAACLFAIGPALAQQADPPTGLPAERHRITADRTGLIDVESGEVLSHLQWDLGIHAGFAKDPLVVYDLGTGERLGSLVERRVGGALVGGVGFFDWVQLSLELPYVLDQAGATTFGAASVRPYPALRSTDVGDLRFIPKVRLLRSDRQAVNVALLASVTVPTGGKRGFLGDSRVTLVPEAAVSRAFGGLRLGVNVAANPFRMKQRIANLEVGPELTTRAGIGFRFHEHNARWVPLELDASVASSTSLTNPYADENQQSLEARGQAGFHLAQRFVLFGGGGFGLLPGYGTPDWRAFGGLRLGSPARQVSGGRSYEAPPELPPDSDKDGIADVNDACPREAELFNSLEDEDGCPEKDGDKDNVADARDLCLEEPENVNGYQDTDGCPDDNDSDKDGVLSPDDQCALGLEDKDDFEDSDGCPDEDNDKDTVLDAQDTCPLEAGAPENKGCPDVDSDGDTVMDRFDNCPKVAGKQELQGCESPQLVIIESDRLFIKETIVFSAAKAKVDRRSFKLLDNVAQILLAHPEITLVRIEGHTDSQGNEVRNLQLSKARAEAVRAYLMKKGIDGDRLRAIGFGALRPIAPNVTKSGRAMNRRVEFNLGEPAPDEDGAPGTLPAAQPELQ